MDNKLKTRRDFIKELGGIAGSTLLLTTPWLQVLATKKETAAETLRVGIIGTGSRGRYLMEHLCAISKAKIVAICDIYRPALDEALSIVPKVKVYGDYRNLLEDNSIDAVIIATPLHVHKQQAIDALEAGKHVLLEKAIARTPEDCLKVYRNYESHNQVMFIGHQRMYDPKYLTGMEMIKKGVIGNAGRLNTYWYRNSNWRRPVPDPSMERQINWRLYKEYSGGTMTELTCHQAQVGNWVNHSVPETIMGSATFFDRNDGRDVEDNVSLIFTYRNGFQMTFNCFHSNKFYGLEEQVIGTGGVMELEKGKYYLEKAPVRPGLLQLYNDLKEDWYSSIPIGGNSWSPEVKKGRDTGRYIMGKPTEGDGSDYMMQAFVESCIRGEKMQDIVEHGYYSSIVSLLALEAVDRKTTVTFPDCYKINYY